MKISRTKEIRPSFPRNISVGRLINGPVLKVTALTALLIAAGGCSSSSGGKDGNISDQDLALSEQNRFGEGNIPGAESGSGAFKDVLFMYDSSTVPDEYQQQVRDAAQALQGDPSLHAEIEGHCDKRGTSEYNMALGERRAKAVASLLVSFGVPSSQLSTVSYGEEIPLVPGDSEDAYAKNRRAHFAVYRQGQGKGA